MPLICSAASCSNKFEQGSGITFHKFPLSNKEALKKWKTAIGRQNWNPTASSKVCSEHFHPNSFWYTSDKRYLLENAVPDSKEPPASMKVLVEDDDESPDGSGEFGERNYSGHEEDKLLGEEEWNRPEMCRLCACGEDAEVKLIPVFSAEGKEMALVDKIHTHLPIMVTPSDLLPISVCERCVQALEISHSLLNTCLEADGRLREIFGFAVNEESQEGNENESKMQEDEAEMDAEVEEGVVEDEEGVEEEEEDDDGEEEEEDEDEDEEDEEMVEGISHTNGDQEGNLSEPDNTSKLVEITVGDPDRNLENAVLIDDKSTIIHLPEEGAETGDGDGDYPMRLNLARIAVVNMNSDEGQLATLCYEVDGFGEGQEGEGELIAEVVTGEDVVNELGVKDGENWVTECYTCYECDFVAMNKNELTLHQKQHAVHLITSEDGANIEPVGTTYACEVCDTPFKILKRLLEHRRTQHNLGFVYKCNQCGDESATWSEYQTHMQTHTEGESGVTVLGSMCADERHACEMCGDVYPTAMDLHMHSITHSTGEAECPLCNKVFVGKDDLREHLVAHTQDKPFKCPHCDMRFGLRRTLSQHVITHGIRNVQDMYTCKVCGTKFKKFRSIMTHAKTDHPDMEITDVFGGKGPFQCSKCGKILSSRKTLEVHLDRHTGKRPYACSMCDKSFAVKDGLNKHVISHTDERPFKCAFCDATFKTAPYRKTHELIHTGETPFKCDQCDKRFRSSANLYQHKVIHSAFKKFRCPHCEYRTGRSEQIQNHIRTHTNERPFCCKICGRGFKQRGDRNSHEKLHYNKDGTLRVVRSRNRDPNPAILLYPISADDDQTGAQVLEHAEVTLVDEM